MHPAVTSKPTMIVCERNGHWADGVRRHLPTGIRVREARTLADCRRELAVVRACLVAVEVNPAQLTATLELIAEVARHYPLTRAVAVAPRGCEPFEGALREAGAIYFTTSPRAADVLARLAVRHAARIPAGRTTFAAQIWDSLPWAEMATS
jgi:hypothetical protein